MSLIHIDHLSKHFKVLNRREGLGGALRDLFSTDYRLVKAVDDISTDIEPGEIVGYIGPNGAGKSTTIKMMTGILQPTSGELLVAGNVPHHNRQKNAQTMGVVFGQRTQLWWDLPVIESFKILKEIYGIDDKSYRHQLGLFNEIASVEALYDKQVRTLSLGQRMLCDIAASFLHSPRVVFLDEPTIGLDVAIKSTIRAVIKQLNTEQHTTIILTTHDLHDVEALCQRIIIIDKGKIIYDGSLREVTELFGAYRTLKVQIFDFNDDTPEALRAKLASRFGAEVTIKIEHTEPGWTDVTINQDEVLLLDVLSTLMAEFAVKDIRVVEMSVENVVQRIYEGALK
jgi:ABC-2 type transport system ATP-binding protein